jgi:hypothetical protein
VCKIASDSGPEVGKVALTSCGSWALVKRHRPRIVAFNGKRSPSVVAGRAVGYGCQPAWLADAAPWVHHSTSAAADDYWDITVRQGLADDARA